MLPTGPICFRCRSEIAHNPGICPECFELRPIVYPSSNDSGVLVCASCAGEESVFACVQCGREDHPYSTLRRCTRCALNNRLTEVLTDPATGRIHALLQPLYNELAAAPRPLSVLGWLKPAPAVPASVLGKMARHELPITHDTFRALPHDRPHNNLRQTLTATGILGPYNAPVEQIERWLDEILNPLDADIAAVIGRYARWRHLRHLRTLAERGTLNKGTIYAARSRVNGAVRLSQWAADHGTTLDSLSQAHLDDYLAEHPGARLSQQDFISWLRRTGTNTAIRIPRRKKTNPEVVVSDDTRWTHIDLLLHDESIVLYARIAGLFTLLFAQPMETIVAMRTSQVHLEEHGRVMVAFDAVPVEMPPGLDTMIRHYLPDRGVTSTTSTDHGWLFPGRPTNRHMVGENVRIKLVAHGVRPGQSRNAAMLTLAAGIPAAVLSELIGINDRTALTWSALAARDWSQYVAQRRLG